MSDLPTFEHPDHPLEYLPGQVILRVRPDAVFSHLPADARVGRSEEAAELLPPAVTEPLDYLRRNAGLRTLEPILPAPTRTLTGAGEGRAWQQRLAVAASLIGASAIPGLMGFSIGRLPQKNLTRDLVRHIGAADAIELFERVPARWLTNSGPAADPVRNLQWGLRAIDWFDSELPDTSGVTLGVIDSGLDREHPAFSGLELDYHHGSEGPVDVVGHGTHVTGTIAAVSDNVAGVAGITRPRLSIWKVLPNEPQEPKQFYVDGESYVRALTLAARSGLVAVNLSLAGSVPSHDFEPEAIKEVIDAGTNVVAAMGNGFEKGDPVMYPATYDGVIAVGSIAADMSRSQFSGTGPYIDLVAPGSHVLSVAPSRRSKYRDKRWLDVQSGTSMAAAHVSATLALLAARYPDWTADDRAERLRQTAKKLPAMGGRNWTHEYGHGLLDVRAALSSK
jgi:subtilisin family serine protease